MKMDRNKIERICSFLGLLLIVGAFFLAMDESNIVGILCVGIGVASLLVKLVLSIWDSFNKATVSIKMIKADLKNDKSSLLNPGFDSMYSEQLKKYYTPLKEQGCVSMTEQKKLLPELIMLFPELSDLIVHPIFQQVEDGKIDDTHGSAELIKTMEKNLSKCNFSESVSKWQRLDNKSLLNAYILLEFYSSDIRDDESLIRIAKYHLSKLLVNRATHLDIMKENEHSYDYHKEYHNCSRCNKNNLADDMYFVDGDWFCHNCFKDIYGENTYE